MDVIVRLDYPPDLVNRPLVFQLITVFHLDVNILRAQVSREEGWLIIELSGDPAQLEIAFQWLRDQGVEVVENPPIDAADAIALENDS